MRKEFKSTGSIFNIFGEGFCDGRLSLATFPKSTLMVDPERRSIFRLSVVPSE
jgi:hypothetical protein